MRILYLLNTLGIGGTERLVVALGERMAARGHAVRIVTLRGARAEEWPTNLDVVPLGIEKSATSLMRGMVQAASVVRGFRPDIVHSHNFHGNVLARLLRPVVPSARIISTLHNEYEGGRGRMLALRLTEPLSDCTVAVSNAVADRALQLRIAARGKCRVISNGVDPAEFKPNGVRRAALRSAMGVGDDFLWLTAGRITEAKDYPNLLRAFAQVRAEAPGIQLWIAGEGEGEYPAALRIKALNLGIDPYVHWLGLRYDMASLLEAADAFVLASAWEGMPLAVAEAMAMEKPVVATGVGGVAELLENCGLVVPPRDPSALARAMMSLLNTPAEARAYLGRTSRRRVLEHFNIEAKADEWERLYEDPSA